MRVGGDLTPQTLQPLGINVYELTESCAFVMKRPAATLDDTYNDLRNLGEYFSDVQDRANALIADMQQQVADICKDLPADKPRSVSLRQRRWKDYFRRLDAASAD